MKWQIYTRGTIPLHRLAVVFLGVHEYTPQLCDFPLYNIIYFNKGGKLTWAWDEKEIRGLGNQVIEKINTSQSQQRHFSQLEKNILLAQKLTEDVRLTDLSALSNNELAKKYEQLHTLGTKTHGFSMPDIDAIDIVFEEFLQNKIRQELDKDISDEEFILVCKKLSVPLHESCVSSEEKEKIKLALTGNNSPEVIDALYQKFWWTNLGWENNQPHSKNFFVQAIEEYSRDGNLEKKLIRLENNSTRARQGRRETCQKYKLSPKVVYWLEVMDKYSYYHDLRKEMHMKINYSLYLMLAETARRFDYRESDLEWLWPDELTGLLKGEKLDRAEVKRRQQTTCVRVSRQEIKTWSGRAAVKQFNRELQIEADDVKEIKGTGVSHGRVEATARVCSGVADALRKVKKGDVLVCGMTLPDYVPAMKRATAIVTDEGGITCHAAVISRELNIPCVVGTRIATQVLQDGDQIEVDADQGIVKKL